LNGGVESRVEELEPNRVRLTVDVDPHDVHHAVEHAANDLAASVKIPGFRRGKVPMPVLIQRVGKERLYQEAVESHISGWFWNAAARARVRPVSNPDYDFELPKSDKEAWSFSATVDVQPKPELPDWKTLEVPKPEAEVPEELVEQELELLRSSVAELAPVEGRPVQPGDTAIVDLVAEGGETQRDYVVEVGFGRLVEEIEAGLVGMRAGEEKEIGFELADDSQRTVTAVVKEIKEKILPPVDDDLAKAASEFETIAELRADIGGRLRTQLDAEIEGAFRAAVVDELVKATNVQPGGPLVDMRTRELLNGLIRSVERRGIRFESYLAMTGTNPDELVRRLAQEAALSVARELVLEAAADQLGIEVPDEEIAELIRESAAEQGEDPDAAVEEVMQHGAYQLREDLRLKKALDRLADEVKPIPVELAEARERIWTPDKEKSPTETKLWTPGSKEPA
jgi:trigger factor